MTKRNNIKLVVLSVFGLLALVGGLMPGQVVYILMDGQPSPLTDPQKHLLASALVCFISMWIVEHKKVKISFSLKVLTMMILFLGGCAVELIQENFVQGRSFSYDDIYMNGIGIILGALVYLLCLLIIRIIIYIVILSKTKSGRNTVIAFCCFVLLFTYLLYNSSYKRSISRYINKHFSSHKEIPAKLQKPSALTTKAIHIIESAQLTKKIDIATKQPVENIVTPIIEKKTTQVEAKETITADITKESSKQIKIQEVKKKPLEQESEVQKDIRRANSGDANSQFVVGNRYLNGNEVKRDQNKAFEWYTRAAENGNDQAHLAVGMCYQNGIGISKDSQKALRSFEKAAYMKNNEALFQAGTCYLKGIGTTQDLKRAACSFEQAAQGGHPGAQLNLGIMYWHGDGVQKNNKKSKLWLQTAAKNGKKKASEILLKLFP